MARARKSTGARRSAAQNYEVLEIINLPVMEQRVVYVHSDGTEITDQVATDESRRLDPGATISSTELAEHGQTTEDIEKLIEAEALREAT
jgi:hypothetical protein